MSSVVTSEPFNRGQKKIGKKEKKPFELKCPLMFSYNKSQVIISLLFFSYHSYYITSSKLSIITKNISKF